MIVTSLARALTHALMDAAIADESARRAAKSALDAGLAPAALALGDVAGAVEAGVGAVTKTAAAAASADADVVRALDFVEQEAGRLASGDFVAALVESASEKAVGAMGGGVGEAATNGEIETMDGLSLSRGLAEGLVRCDELATALGQRALRAGAGLAAGGAATALADREHGADAFRYGAQLGLRLDGLRVEDDAFSRALTGAALATEWSVAGGLRAHAADVDWTEALGFGHRVGANAAALAEGTVGWAASIEKQRVHGSSEDRNAPPTEERAASAQRGERNARLAELTTAVGGAAGLAAELAHFVAEREAAARSRVAAASGDEHAARAARASHVEAEGLGRLRGVGVGLDRAAAAIRSRVPRSDGPEARSRPLASSRSTPADRVESSRATDASERRGRA